MKDDVRSRPVGMWLGAAGAALLLLAVGGAAGVWWSGRGIAPSRAPAESASPKPGSTIGSHSGHGEPAGTSGSSTSAGSAGEPVEVSIGRDAAERAGIRVAEVRRQAVGSAITVPGTVTSNAYRETKVNALVGGIVRDVRVELGTAVRRSEPLAVVFSNELAEAQMKYLSLRATIHAENQKVDRTRRLAEIGAASRQELEEVTATATARATEVAAARQRLLLLGLAGDQVDRLSDASQIVSELTLLAPADGAVITRSINAGQVIAAGQELFVVADLSTVWVIGDLYEKDFAAVRAGTPATVIVATAPRAPVRGRVAYIDPRVDPATRTAKVRVEVPNHSGALRLGMFAQVAFEAMEGRTAVVVPRAAVQAIGERNVVYVATEEEGRFLERTVRLGASGGDGIEVLEGLRPGERVVTEGSFFLRAEAGRARNAG